MIKVGTYRVVNGKKKRYSYAAVKFDSKGWADSSLYLPEDYDLITMQTAQNAKYNGWINGRNWEGLRVEGKLDVTRWRKKREIRD